MAVEQVGLHRVLHRDLVARHADGAEAAAAAAQLVVQFGKDLLGIEEGVLVMEQHLAIAHRDHIVVEHALVDHRRVLLSVDHSGLAQPVQTRDGLAGFQGLARRIALRRREATVEGAATEDEELHAGIAIVLAEARVVGRAFVAELAHCRQRRVMGEMPLVVEHRRQHAAGGGMLDGSVELAVQVGRGEMHAAIGGVGTRADRGGIGGPHARSRAAGGEERHRFLRRAADHLLVAAGEAQATQRSGIRAGLRSEYPLLETHLHQRLHLRQALLRRFLRVGHRLAVALRSDIAVGQAAVVVGRADQAVEIHFMGIHRLIPGVRVAGRDTLGLSSEATG
ncbi:Uncharacterised protein [Acinetobacter baumannii]|nr:Uncharacterised protein [Acinetobacter baumannii]